MEYNQYHLHSGGAVGADLEWAKQAKVYLPSVEITHWRPYHYQDLPPVKKQPIDLLVRTCAEVLHRPSSFPGIDLVKRNYFQVYHSKVVYAISTIIPPGGLDKGFRNTSGKEVVAGGTGWAVEMAIQMGKPVYVFDQGREKWYEWYTSHNFFYPIEETIPPLPQSFAGIGSRNLTERGKQAIREVYLKTVGVAGSVSPAGEPSLPLEPDNPS